MIVRARKEKPAEEGGVTPDGVRLAVYTTDAPPVQGLGVPDATFSTVA